MKRFLATSLIVLSIAMMANGAHAQMTNAAKSEIAKTESGVSDVKPLTNAAEFREAVVVPGTASLMGSKLALDKATNPKVVEFAQFEMDEQTALGMILKELHTSDAEGTAEVQDGLKKLNAAKKGAEFDKVYIQSQIDGHEILLKMTESYLKNADLKSTDPKEMEARHLAYFMKAAITQHIANTTDIRSMLK